MACKYRLDLLAGACLFVKICGSVDEEIRYGYKIIWHMMVLQFFDCGYRVGACGDGACSFGDWLVL